MTLQTCSPSEWWNDSAALPTIATLRLEFQRAEAEHAEIESGMDIETAGEPDEWVCPPECEACHNSGAACGLCGGGNYGDAQSDTCQHCDDGWEPCDCGSEDGRHSESCAMGPCRYCGGAK